MLLINSTIAGARASVIARFAFVYMFIIVAVNALGGMMWDGVKALYELIFN